MEKKSNFLFLHLLPSLSPYSTFYGNSFLGATFLHTMMLMMIALPFVSLFLNLWLSPLQKMKETKNISVMTDDYELSRENQELGKLFMMSCIKAGEFMVLLFQNLKADFIIFKSNYPDPDFLFTYVHLFVF